MIDNWTIVMGAGLPFLIGWVISASWSERQKTLVSFMICAIAATITALFDNKLSFYTIPETFVRVINDVFTVSLFAMGLYSQFYKKAGFVRPMRQ